MNLPNAITVGRIVLIPVFFALAYGRSTAAAVIVFLVASASDSLDGYLARRHGTVSRAGQFLDPLADKLLVGAALVVLVDTRPFPLWAAIVIAVREVAVQVLRIRVVSTGADLPASPAAKYKTFTQLVMVSWWLLFKETNAGSWIWLAAALSTTAWSRVEYFVRARHVGEVVR